MRVIRGSLKGRMIKGYETKGTRATMDRVKESLFAMIQDHIEHTVCLDLFAGSGALGIEAISNGAKECYFVDHNKIAVQKIKENIENFHIEEQSYIMCMDALKFLKKCTSKFDLVFLDPPYQSTIYQEVFSLLSMKKLLNNDALIVMESNLEAYHVEDSRYIMYKMKKYGDKYIRIYQYKL